MATRSASRALFLRLEQLASVKTCGERGKKLSYKIPRSSDEVNDFTTAPPEVETMCELDAFEKRLARMSKPESQGAPVTVNKRNYRIYIKYFSLFR